MQSSSALQLLAALLFVMPAHAGDIVGRASVIDGDTIEIHDTRIRLDAIDAPESWQQCSDARGVDYPCGRRAADALDALLAGSRPTHCRQVDVDRYRRIVAVCTRNDGQDVGRWLVRSGFAIVYHKYSHGQYDAEEEYASRRKLGIWRGWFLNPSLERARRR